MKRKAIIFGIKKFKLSRAEKILIKKNKPWGIILFSRNIKNLKQVKELVNEIKLIIGDNKYPILIDQEGGVVCRLNRIFDMSIFTQEHFGNLYTRNKKLFFYYYKIYIDAVSDILNIIGININTSPVLDLRRSGAHNIIGTRSFSKKTNIVKLLGKICINLYSKNKIGTVIKHVPGHGASMADSHKKLPIINISKKNLSKKDFKPFVGTNSFFAMTAHIVYSRIDKKNTATHSKSIIKKIIRKQIGFKGILISDDISMKALKYDLETNAKKAIAAGCNIILHCNGNIKEMHKLAKILPNIDSFTIKKTSDFYNFLG
jgi:beta-N-acetylhexosaminidase